MATPPSAVAAEMFQGEAARATAALQRAIRAAMRATQVGRGLDDPAPPKPVDRENLSASAWKHHGALSAFRMKGTGTVYFTAGRDVVAARGCSRRHDYDVSPTLGDRGGRGGATS
eukprot:4016635-Pleurochrysis_carterae.AAC.1